MFVFWDRIQMHRCQVPTSCDRYSLCWMWGRSVYGRQGHPILHTWWSNRSISVPKLSVLTWDKNCRSHPKLGKTKFTKNSPLMLQSTKQPCDSILASTSTVSSAGLSRDRIDETPRWALLQICASLFKFKFAISVALSNGKSSDSYLTI